MNVLNLKLNDNVKNKSNSYQYNINGKPINMEYLFVYVISKMYNKRKYYVVDVEHKNYDIDFLLRNIEDSFKLLHFCNNKSEQPLFGCMESDLDSEQGQLFLKYVKTLNEIDPTWKIEKMNFFWFKRMPNYCIINGIEKSEFEIEFFMEKDNSFDIDIICDDNKYNVKEHVMEKTDNIDCYVPYIIYCKNNHAYYDLSISETIGLYGYGLFEDKECIRYDSGKIRLYGNKEMNPIYINRIFDKFVDFLNINEVKSFLKDNEDIEIHLLKEIDYKIVDIGKIESDDIKSTIGELDDRYKSLYL